VVSAYTKSSFCRLNLKKFALVFIILLCQNLAWGANFVINNDQILSQKVSQKLNEIGSELYQKSGINLVVGVYKDGELEALFKEQNQSSPFVFLALIRDKKKVESVRKALDEIQPERLMILGTSENMIGKITKALGIPGPSYYIHIEDVATPKDIEKAQHARLKEGKHIIPVPTVELKPHFKGFLLFVFYFDD